MILQVSGYRFLCLTETPRVPCKVLPPASRYAKLYPDAPWDWNIYMHENHTFKPNVGRYYIHGTYRVEDLEKTKIKTWCLTDPFLQLPLDPIISSKPLLGEGQSTDMFQMCFSHVETISQCSFNLSPKNNSKYHGRNLTLTSVSRSEKTVSVETTLFPP